MRHAQNGYTDASMWQAWERSGLAGLCAGILARSGLDKATAERHILPMEKQPVSAHAVPVALARCEGYDRRSLDQLVGEVLDAARIAQSCSLKVGTKVLVKPNLLMGRSLACTSPGVVAAACRWLRDHGAQMAVADSPGFGRARSVARAIGLESALRPLGLEVRELDRPVPISLPLPQGSRSAHSGKAGTRFHVARAVHECDFILSLPRVKAHSQMLITLAVKNCFGCVSGLHKAVAHAREGRDPTYFADCLAALWAVLPPVAALADGGVAMHVTGPSGGKPFVLHLMGASASAVALDEALYAVFGLAPEAVPLGAALARRKAQGSAASGTEVTFPLLRPENFDARGFDLPRELSHTSFHPARFVQSCLRRIIAAVKK